MKLYFLFFIFLFQISVAFAQFSTKPPSTDSLTKMVGNRYFEKKNVVIKNDFLLSGNELFNKNEFYLEIDFNKKNARYVGIRLEENLEPKDTLQKKVKISLDYQNKTISLIHLSKNMATQNIRIEKQLQYDLPDLKKQITLKFLVFQNKVVVYGTNNQIIFNETLYFSNASKQTSSSLLVYTEKKKVKVNDLKIWDLYRKK